MPISYPCPVCKKPIMEVRPIVFKCPEHNEFTIMEINRAMPEPAEKEAKRKTRKRQDAEELF